MVTHPAQHKGFTLIELMVTIVVFSILLTIGVPSLTSYMDQQKVIAAVEDAYTNIQQAKIQALTRSSDIYLNFSGSGSTSWKYGFSESQNCLSSGCTISIGTGSDSADISYEWSSSNYKNVTLTSNLSSAFFDSSRGLFSNKLLATFSYSGYEASVIVSNLSRISVCSQNGSIGRYSGC